jgi:hypothetical protein
MSTFTISVLSHQNKTNYYKKICHTRHAQETARNQCQYTRQTTLVWCCQRRLEPPQKQLAPRAGAKNRAPDRIQRKTGYRFMVTPAITSICNKGAKNSFLYADAGTFHALILCA